MISAPSLVRLIFLSRLIGNCFPWVGREGSCGRLDGEVGRHPPGRHRTGAGHWVVCRACLLLSGSRGVFAGENKAAPCRGASVCNGSLLALSRIARRMSWVAIVTMHTRGRPGCFVPVRNGRMNIEEGRSFARTADDPELVHSVGSGEMIVNAMDRCPRPRWRASLGDLQNTLTNKL